MLSWLSFSLWIAVAVAIIATFFGLVSIFFPESLFSRTTLRLNQMIELVKVLRQK